VLARIVASCSRRAPTPEVERRTTGANNVAEAGASGDVRRQADFAAAGYPRLANGGDNGFNAMLRSAVNSLNQWIRYLLFRQPVGLTTKQNRLDWIRHPHGNGWAMKSDNQHGPLILTEETPFRHSVIREMAKREAFASYGSSSKGESLPGMADVVQTIPIGPVSVFPSFAPGNAGQNEDQGGRGVDESPAKISDGALFSHVG
jgi:hypothetical protein